MLHKYPRQDKLPERSKDLWTTTAFIALPLTGWGVIPAYVVFIATGDFGLGILLMLTFLPLLIGWAAFDTVYGTKVFSGERNTIPSALAISVVNVALIVLLLVA